MTTRWKDNFKHFAMELLFSTYSVLEVEEKLMEDVVRNNMEGAHVFTIFANSDLQERNQTT
jgi:hypothetical protein